MSRPFFHPIAALALVCAAAMPARSTAAEITHGIAMYGVPALPPDFVALPYANPDAPRGGTIRLGEQAGFDSLNPFILKGSAPPGVATLTVETLLGRSYDEPFTLYGLVAESVRTAADRSWVEFTLRPEARFSDGTPVTVDDVIWSLQTLGTQGSPVYAGAWAKVAAVTQTGPRALRIDFAVADRELALIMGLRPVLKMAQWQDREFGLSSLVPVTGSGPYIVGAFEPGRYISYVKNPDWWGAMLPFNRGRHNLGEVRYDFFTDAGVMFEAFKAGEITSFRELNAAHWQTNYGFAAVASGEIVRSEIPHRRPSGIAGLVMNTRRPVFADWRVREALTLAFNFEFINRTVTGGTEPRITSFFSNSPLGMGDGPATDRVRELLEPFAAELPPGVLDAYAPPVSDGSEPNRANMRKATAMLSAAGWQVRDGVLRDAGGNAFAFEILLVQGTPEPQAVAEIYVEALKRLGIAARITTIDNAQYVERTRAYDFDMTQYARSLSLSPGNEQMFYWGSAGVTEPGSRNLMGMNSPAAEAMIARMLATDDPAEFRAATQALDRVLTTGRYVIPQWYAAVSRIAHDRSLRFPARLPLYGDWIGFQPDVWWQER